MMENTSIIFSPRSKIRTVRDFIGFTSVERIKLDSNDVVLGDLDGEAGEKEENKVVYMHVCTKNNG